jgi:hypothetical protein
VKAHLQSNLVTERTAIEIERGVQQQKDFLECAFIGGGERREGEIPYKEEILLTVHREREEE